MNLRTWQEQSSTLHRICQRSAENPTERRSRKWLSLKRSLGDTWRLALLQRPREESNIWTHPPQPLEVASCPESTDRGPRQCSPARRRKGGEERQTLLPRKLAAVSVLYKKGGAGALNPDLVLPPRTLITAEGDGQYQGPPGSGALGPKQGDRPRGGTSAPEPVCHLEGDPSPGGASQPKRLSLPRSAAITSGLSPSSPTAALPTAAAASTQGARVASGRAPLPPMCPSARAQSQAPPPPDRPPVAGGVGKVTSRSYSLSFGTRREPGQGGPSRARTALLSARNRARGPVGAPFVAGSAPRSLRSLPGCAAWFSPAAPPGRYKVYAVTRTSSKAGVAGRLLWPAGL